jgi:tRNA(fMet)-specific endonuclease VapC
MANRDYPLIQLRKSLGLGQSEMATRMGLSLRPYQELESKARNIRRRHIVLAESVALDIAIEKENLELAPDTVRKKMIKLALMLVQQNLQERPLGIAKSILGQDQKWTSTTLPFADWKRRKHASITEERHPHGRIFDRVSEVGEEDVCTSVIVAAELRYEATKKNSSRFTSQLEAVLGALEVLALEAPVDAVYGVIRTGLERNGQPIGANGMLMAAHALALDLTLVTDNERDFSRIGQLRVENWLR